MLMQAQRSCLLIVDIQERLLPAIHAHQRLEDNAAWLMQLAAELDVPVMISEQYPRGLGHTSERLQQLALSTTILEKVHFSCTASPECLAQITDSGRQQWVVAGIEAHVCVLQTALGLLQQGREVFVVADAVSSRKPQDTELALQRLARAGVQIVSREMVAFEWLHEAGTERFREVSKRFLR